MKYKVLASAAHNFGHSFISGLNSSAMSEIAWAVDRTGEERLEIDLLTGHAKPRELTPEPVLVAIARYHEWFPRHLERHGIEPTAVVDARMVLTFEPEGRVDRYSNFFWNAWDMPVECVVTIQDDRGKEHQSSLRDRCGALPRWRSWRRWLHPRYWYRLA